MLPEPLNPAPDEKTLARDRLNWQYVPSYGGRTP